MTDRAVELRQQIERHNQRLEHLRSLPQHIYTNRLIEREEAYLDWAKLELRDLTDADS